MIKRFEDKTTIEETIKQPVKETETGLITLWILSILLFVIMVILFIWDMFAGLVFIFGWVPITTIAAVMSFEVADGTIK